jgi:hypothetical protein
MHSERRPPRHPLIAAVEITELQLNTRSKARTSDVSLVGCYVDTVNPLPVGTEIRVQLTHQGTTFTALGVVAHYEQNMGMGVSFTAVEPDQQVVLEKWIAGS